MRIENGGGAESGSKRAEGAENRSSESEGRKKKRGPGGVEGINNSRKVVEQGSNNIAVCHFVA